MGPEWDPSGPIGWALMGPKECPTSSMLCGTLGPDGPKGSYRALMGPMAPIGHQNVVLWL